MEIKTLFKDYTLQLKNLYPEAEAENLVHWLFEHFLGLNRADLHRGKNIDPVPPALEQAQQKLSQGMPIQYILQSAPFYGRDFFVNAAVLIPRNETEELVHLIIKENKGAGLRILDIGTGSGCIPVTLGLEMNAPSLWAVDISAAALEVARINAESFGVQIAFAQSDILFEALPFNRLDILVSNPPYIPESDKAGMHRNVLDHEPHLALFVPEEDPLLFYRHIAEKGKIALNPGGKLYFEIHERLGRQVTDLLASLNYQKIRMIKDLNDRERIVGAEKP
ncbi:MAG TPA: peptide chain release factor N(5)-glutamine methyltransferase [Cyclobacteriaceae bacterium]|nr:peptide chain release factor N(5)-glutamine methyltransferase [Cyclobacteriaceae bacterium]